MYISAGSSSKITLNDVFAKAIANAMGKNKEIFGRICFGNFRQAKEIGLTTYVDHGKDLELINVLNPETKSIKEISAEMSASERGASKELLNA